MSDIPPNVHQLMYIAAQDDMIAAGMRREKAEIELSAAKDGGTNKPRLERIATAVLAGQVAFEGMEGNMRYDNETAKWAVEYARALIAEIDKEPQ